VRSEIQARHGVEAGHTQPAMLIYSMTVLCTRAVSDSRDFWCTRARSQHRTSWEPPARIHRPRSIPLLYHPGIALLTISTVMRVIPTRTGHSRVDVSRSLADSSVCASSQPFEDAWRVQVGSVSPDRSLYAMSDSSGGRLYSAFITVTGQTLTRYS